MPSNADVAVALHRAANAVVLAAAPFEAPVVLIDGRSGAGKSTLAAALAARLGVPLLALDSLYPGWDGLAAGAVAVRLGVLAPLAAGEPGCWRRWDWEREALAETHTVAPGRGLVVEGSGVLTPESAELSDVSVWVESPVGSRRERALLRDGETYRPHWERWAAQEDAHVRSHRPDQLATLVVTVP